MECCLWIFGSNVTLSCNKEIWLYSCNTIIPLQVSVKDLLAQACVVPDDDSHQIIVYDQCTSDPTPLASDCFLMVLLQKLVTVFKNVALLRGQWHTLFSFKSLWSNDAIWCHGSGSALAQVMACCLTAPSHYLSHCWLIISKVQWNSSEVNFTRCTSVINH